VGPPKQHGIVKHGWEVGLARNPHSVMILPQVHLRNGFRNGTTDLEAQGLSARVTPSTLDVEEGTPGDPADGFLGGSDRRDCFES
jgi:hypothetical protein